MLAPLAPPAEMVAMIGGKHDDGVVSKPFGLQMIEQPANMLIEHRYGGVVGLGRLTLQRLAGRQARLLEERFER